MNLKDENFKNISNNQNNYAPIQDNNRYNFSCNQSNQKILNYNINNINNININNLSSPIDFKTSSEELIKLLDKKKLRINDDQIKNNIQKNCDININSKTIDNRSSFFDKRKNIVENKNNDILININTPSEISVLKCPEEIEESEDCEKKLENKAIIKQLRKSVENLLFYKINLCGSSNGKVLLNNIHIIHNILDELKDCNTYDVKKFNLIF